jgi:transposase-like protein
MNNFKVIPKETKEQIIGRVKNNGEAVASLAREYDISTKTIYRWLGNQTASAVSILEHARLKRENKLLLEIVGRLTLEKNKPTTLKKN